MKTQTRPADRTGCGNYGVDTRHPQHSRPSLRIPARRASSRGRDTVNITPLDALRLQRGVEHLHQLGPRATAELMTELTARIGGLPAILGLLEEYQRLTPAMLHASGGDRFPPRSLHKVRA